MLLTKKKLFLIFIAQFLCLLFLQRASWTQEESAPDSEILSREMQRAIRLYDQGRDEAAMDSLMEVMVHGDANEKALATDYLNRLVMRMNKGESAPRSRISETPAAPVPAREPEEEKKKSEPKKKPEEPLAPTLEKSPSSPQGTTASSEESFDPEERQGRMRRKILEVMQEMRREYLTRLSSSQGVQVSVQEGMLLALGLEGKSLFKTDASFRIPQAEEVLSDVTGLLYTLGEAQVVVIPEGFLAGESKVQDMRRAMAVEATLLKRGISPARLQVALLGSTVKVPSFFHRFSGVVLVLLYGKEPNLIPSNSVGEESGPAVSLGVFPTRVIQGQSKGSIIEFSVLEPSVGLASWKFQILHLAGGDEMTSVQEAVGSKPVFHQIFWNGRKDLSGEMLPSGRYLCLLSATDIKGRENTVRATLTLGHSRSEAENLEAQGESSPAPKPSPGRVLYKKPNPPVLKKPLVVKAKRKLLPKPLPSPAASAPSKPEESEPAPGVSRTVNYEVNFLPASTGITPDGEKSLAQVADSMSYYPLAKLTLVGYAYDGEPNASAMANKRAQVVSSILVNQYRVDPQRIQVQTKVLNQEISKVEVYLVGRD
ncbi:MAG: hypothetical protein HY399_04020 [Elusimicrobia bacterium]|nr:hypothetical protein [Elusimicrobiota bacterium]